MAKKKYQTGEENAKTQVGLIRRRTGRSKVERVEKSKRAWYLQWQRLRDEAYQAYISSLNPTQLLWKRRFEIAAAQMSLAVKGTDAFSEPPDKWNLDELPFEQIVSIQIPDEERWDKPIGGIDGER